MPASDLAAPNVALTDGQARVLHARGITILTGPPGCGKTTALAAFAGACAGRGGLPLIVVSHESSRAAFAEGLTRTGYASARFSIASLAEHAAAWMRAEYLGSSVHPSVCVGGAGATRAITERAAAGLLEMTWPMFARSDVNLDLPYLARPGAFLDEASSLFRLLRRSRISVAEFEEGCARGLGAFYGEQTERAAVLLADRSLHAVASRRGREAMRASAGALGSQRRAERDLATILVQLYQAYLEEADRSAWRAPEDLIDACLRWFESDPSACERVARSIDALIVDDADDAEPLLAALLGRLRSTREVPLLLAGWNAARIDGLAGRRSALAAFGDADHLTLEPLGVPPPVETHRLETEAQEIAWLAEEIGALIGQGRAPDSIAVLTRDADAAAHYARSLAAAALPAVMPASRVERPVEIADLFALAAVVEDPFDQAHLLRVLSSPLAGLSDASLRTMCRQPAERQQLRLEIGEELAHGSSGNRPPPGTLARNMLDGSADAGLSEEARASVRSLREDLVRWRVSCADMPRATQFVFLAKAGGFWERWHAAAYERPRLFADFERLLAAIVSIEAADPDADFTAIEALLEDEVVRLDPVAPTPGAISVETIVGCKGRRFEHVFVSGVAHERFPRIYTSHAIAFSRTYGLIVRENVARGAAQTAKFAWYYARFAAKNMYLDEERRALDYALSRGTLSATATGFGRPPQWARDQDLLAKLEAAAPSQVPAS